jgi:hypothetical protein
MALSLWSKSFPDKLRLETVDFIEQIKNRPPSGKGTSHRAPSCA